jgi:hypothetical protein
MTDKPQLSPEDMAAIQAQIFTREITNRQIDAAVMMASDPENWAFTPLVGTTRTFYRRIRRRGA